MKQYDITKDGQISIADVTAILDYLANNCGHNVITLEEKKPTCITPGHTKRQYCSLCKAEFVEYTELPETGIHTYVDNQCTGCGLFLESQGLSFTDKGTYYSVKDRGTCSDTTIVIPKEYNGKPVKEIEDYAFNANQTIKRIILPENVTEIGEYAFFNCTALFEAVLPETLNRIGTCAFYNCSALSSITIPKNLEVVETSAFLYCTGIKTVYISDLRSWCEIKFSAPAANPLYYAQALYLNGSPLEGMVTIPEGTERICAAAFANCSEISGVQIPSSVTAVGSDAFYACYALKDVYISDLRTFCEIDFPGFQSSPLYHARNLYLNGQPVTGSLQIPQGTTRIGDYSLIYANITELVIPNSVTSIGNRAFYCSSLTSVNIPGSVTEIGELAFYWSQNVENVQIQSGVTSIGRMAFGGLRKISTVVIPESVETMGNTVFGECTSLSHIYCKSESLPDNWHTDWAKNCTAGVFWGEEWEYVNGIPQIKEDEAASKGLSFTKNADNTTCTLSGMGECTDADLVIPKTHNGMAVTVIGDWAFEISSCGISLGAVELPDSITTIGNGAFDHQNTLLKVTLSEGLEEIGSHAFAYTGLSELVIPKSVDFIGANAFYGCSDLKNIYLESDTLPESWDTAWLNNCSATVHLGDGRTYVNGIPTVIS